MAGSCPKCDAVVNSVRMEEVLIFGPDGAQWKGVKYVCLSCDSVLSVSLDPVSMDADLVDDLFDALRKDREQ